VCFNVCIYLHICILCQGISRHCLERRAVCVSVGAPGACAGVKICIGMHAFIPVYVCVYVCENMY
jgi:hypothetical protein